MANDSTWLTIDQASSEIGMSRRTIYNWIRAGLVTIQRTASGRLRVRKDSLYQPNSVRPSIHAAPALKD